MNDVWRFEKSNRCFFVNPIDTYPLMVYNQNTLRGYVTEGGYDDV